MQFQTTLDVDLLRAFRVAAVQHGNVIEVNRQLVGVEEACSGIRSLQATLMISLFLGAYYSFSLVPRLILIFAGAIFAFIFNLIRTLILVWIAATYGVAQLEKWHDSTGMTILFACLFALWGLSLAMGKYAAQPRADSSAGENRGARIVPWSFIAALGVWLAIVEISVAAWYRSPSKDPAATRWSVQWPVNEKSYKEIPVGRTAQTLLRYDEGGGARWEMADGHIINMFFFRWLPGRTAALFVKNHRPDICLPAAGMTMRSESNIRIITVNDMSLPVRAYRFDNQGTPLHVYYCYWDGRISSEIAAHPKEDWTASGRLAATRSGKRDVGAQMLELAVWGYNDDADAERALADQLSALIPRS
jgi:exosortase/archaeosortase family protein